MAEQAEEDEPGAADVHRRRQHDGLRASSCCRRTWRKVGAISLLSWIVTALGSMAIAYGFAQAGLFNQRPGGMAAYAEDAYGKAGYFQVFFLYFLSLAIANVAVAISARGLSGGVLPVALVDADRHLHRRDRAALADHGRQLRRPEPDRPHRLGDGLGRDPAGRAASRSSAGSGSSRATFAAAWNPQGLSLAAGHGLEHRAHLVGVPRHGIGGAELRRRREPEARTCRWRACSARSAPRSSTSSPPR